MEKQLCWLELGLKRRVDKLDGEVLSGSVQLGVRVQRVFAVQLRVRVVKEESERKDKPCVCVRKELQKEFVKPVSRRFGQACSGSEREAAWFVVLSLVEKLVRRRRPSGFASEDTCEGEDVPTGTNDTSGRRQGSSLFFFLFSFWVFVCVCVCREASSVIVEIRVRSPCVA